MSAQEFWDKNPEDGDHNQYWYSNYSIDKMVEDITICDRAEEEKPAEGRVTVILSAPSVYFSLPDDVRANSYIFDFDQGPNKIWEKDRGYVFYDFNKPTEIPENLLGKCDMVLIDPPFIVHEVWAKYAETAKLLLKTGNDSKGVPLGKCILTTVIENEPFLTELLGAKATNFQPSIPNLVYQYNLFTNYPSTVFCNKNPEIPE